MRSPSLQTTPADPAAEAALVHAADDALRRDDARAALALLRDHAHRFPHGDHAEERDRLAIEALIHLGQRDAARRAADQFLTHYPASIYRARIEGLLP